MVIICLFVLFAFAQCEGQVNGLKKEAPMQEERETPLTQKKNRLRSDFVIHFPEDTETDSTTIALTLSPDNNDISLLLYEYGMQPRQIDSLKKVIKRRVVAKYSLRDTCHLIVNRFENTNPYDSENTIVLPNAVIDRDCYKGKLPVPNFMDYIEGSTPALGRILDETFTLFVLEAKSDKEFVSGDMNPSPHMPDNWKNGYSRGIAISETHGTVIYWSIAW